MFLLTLNIDLDDDTRNNPSGEGFYIYQFHKKGDVLKFLRSRLTDIKKNLQASDGKKSSMINVLNKACKYTHIISRYNENYYKFKYSCGNYEIEYLIVKLFDLQSDEPFASIIKPLDQILVD